MQCTANLNGCKDDNFQVKCFNSFLILAQIIVGTRSNRLNEAVLRNTHNLLFRAKVRKNVYACKPQFRYKIGCKRV